MDNRCGTCPDCGGWLCCDDEITGHITCDTLNADGESPETSGR